MIYSNVNTWKLMLVAFNIHKISLTEGMILNILCIEYSSYIIKHSKSKNLFDYTCSKYFSIKLWPVLGFLNTYKQKCRKFCNVAYWGRVQRTPIPILGPFWMINYTREKSYLKRGIYMGRSNNIFKGAL